jgi:hypothetical protein
MIVMQRRAFIEASASVLLGAMGCKDGGTRMNANPEPTESLAALGKELDLVFPPSARLIGVRRSPGGMDDAVRVKLELSTAELPSLLTQTKIETASFRPGARGMLGPDGDFWDPHASASLRTGQDERAGGRVLNVGVDESREGVAVLYLVEHGT